MKISLNANIVEGAWGGGNQAVKSLCRYLISNGVQVVTNLKVTDIDLILMIHPNRYPEVRSYGIDKIRDYVELHPNTVLVHRVNTTGEFHRGTGRETQVIFEANKFADFSIFISTYLRDLYVRQGFDINRPHTVILNGADETIFYPQKREHVKQGPVGTSKLKIITHHWSSNYMKGFDIYERLGVALGNRPFCDLFEFTIVGNVPKGVEFRNTRILSPLSGSELACEIRKHHIYLTASRNEGAGMHHIEAMRCGLPVLYLNSGALPEYCAPYGIQFTLIDFEQKLLEMRENIAVLRERVLKCPYSATFMASEYAKVLVSLIAERQAHPVLEPPLAKKLAYCLINKQTNKIGEGYNFLKKVKRQLFP
jgi:glycosyltransferase involved in cell wall biosynthesis